MSRPTKRSNLRQSGLLVRLWSWLRGLFRSQGNAAKLLDTATEEATAPFSPPVVSKRVPLADLPVRPRLLPSMVSTAKLPATEAEETTKSPIPTELKSLPLPVSVESPKRMALLSIPVKNPTLWTAEETQRFQAPRLVSLLEQEAREALLVRAREVTAKRRQELAQEAAKAAAPQRAQAPERVPTSSPEPTPSTPEAKMSAARELESAIHSMPDAEEWEEPRNVVIHGSQTMLPILPADMAPPTLVQARVQDSPELLDLIKEFEEKHGGSEP